MCIGVAIDVYSKNMIVKQNVFGEVSRCVKHSENTLYRSLFLSVIHIYLFILIVFLELILYP